MTTYHVLFSAVVDADAEDTAVEEARLLISQPKYEPLEIKRESPTTEPLPICGNCKHAYFYHRESREWQMLFPRRKKNLMGCTKAGCACLHMKVPVTR